VDGLGKLRKDCQDFRLITSRYLLCLGSQYVNVNIKTYPPTFSTGHPVEF